MEKFIKKTVFTFTQLGYALSPVLVYAQIQNPLQHDNIYDFIFALIRIAIYFAAPVLALMIIVAGYMYTTGGGNKEKVEKAGKTIKYAIIGFIIIIAAWVIVAILQGVLTGGDPSGGNPGGGGGGGGGGGAFPI